MKIERTRMVNKEMSELRVQEEQSSLSLYIKRVKTRLKISMSRVRAKVKIGERNCWALFDTGARNTYIVKDIASSLPTIKLDRAEPVALGGWRYEVMEESHLTCLVEGLPVRTHARVLDEIGEDEEGRRIEVLIGALAMQEWGIRPLPDEERLDMSHYPKEFIEFKGL